MKTSPFKLISRLSLLALLPFLMTSCVGPRGPQGPPGQDGRDGNANVFSINYEVLIEDWYDVGTPGTDEFFLAVDLDVPEITSDIVENGVVLVYYRADLNSPWLFLPYTFISHKDGYVEKLDFIYDLQFVGLQSMATDKNASAWEGFFRVVIADGWPAGKVEVDKSSYQDVANFLQITEEMQQFR
jgi:hypothetical protein